MNMNRLLARGLSGAGLALVAAVLAVGCGGGGGGGGSALTAEEYGKELNTICADYDARVKAIGEPGSIEELGTKGPKLRAEFDRAIAKAEKLEPPDELAETHDQFIAKGKQLSGLIGDLIEAAKKNDAKKIAEVGTQAELIGNESDKLGEKLGAPACASGQ
jgi:hypothetical protein